MSRYWHVCHSRDSGEPRELRKTFPVRIFFPPIPSQLQRIPKQPSKWGRSARMGKKGEREHPNPPFHFRVLAGTEMSWMRWEIKAYVLNWRRLFIPWEWYLHHMKSYGISLNFTQGKGRTIQQNGIKGTGMGKNAFAFRLLPIKSNSFNKVLHLVYAHILWWVLWAKNYISINNNNNDALCLCW